MAKTKNEIGYIKYAGLAFQFLFYLLAGWFIGKFIDQKLSTEKPYFSAALMLLFFVGFFIKFYREINKEKN